MEEKEEEQEEHEEEYIDNVRLQEAQLEERSRPLREKRRRTKCQMQVRRKMCAAGDQMGRRSIA